MDTLESYSELCDSSRHMILHFGHSFLILNIMSYIRCIFHSVNILVMQKKCEHYWPDQDSVRHGGYIVKLERETSWPDFTLRELSIAKVSMQSYRVTNMRMSYYLG